MTYDECVHIAFRLPRREVQAIDALLGPINRLENRSAFMRYIVHVVLADPSIAGLVSPHLTDRERKDGNDVSPA